MVGLNLMKAVDHVSEAYFSLGEKGVGWLVGEGAAQETCSVIWDMLDIS